MIYANQIDFSRNGGDYGTVVYTDPTRVVKLTRRGQPIPELVGSLNIPLTVNSGNTPSGDFAELTYYDNSPPVDADISSEYNFNFSRPKSGNVKLTVSSSGFNSSGDAVTVKRYVFATSAVRKPYPNDGETNYFTGAEQVTALLSLSSPIYATDTITRVDFKGGWLAAEGTSYLSSNITNNSDRVYPKPIVRSITAPFKNMNGPELIEVAAKHLFGISCVKFSLKTEGGTVIDSITTSDEVLAANSPVGDGTVQPEIPCFAATLDPAANVGNVKVVYEVFPLAGDVTFDSEVGFDGVASIDDREGPLRYIANNTPSIYAVSLGGNDGTGVADTDEATARTNPYATITGAISDGAGEGDVIVLESGTHSHGTLTIGNQNGWSALEIRNADGVTDAIYAGSTNNTLTGIVRVTGCSAVSTETGAFRGAQDVGSALIFEDLPQVAITGLAAIYQWDSVYIVNCDSVNIRDMAAWSTSKLPHKLVRGSHFEDRGDVDHVAHLICCVGNTGYFKIGRIDDTYSVGGSNNSIATNCFLRVPIVDSHAISVSGAPTTGGLTGVCFENIAIVHPSYSATVPSIFVFGDGAGEEIHHALIRHVTSLDQRSNLFYNDEGVVTVKSTNIQVVGTLFDSLNIKSDDFLHPTDGRQTARTGNWAWKNSTNSWSNHQQIFLSPYFKFEYEQDNTIETVSIDADGFTPLAGTTPVGRVGGTPCKYDLTGQFRGTSFTAGAVELDPQVMIIETSNSNITIDDTQPINA